MGILDNMPHVVTAKRRKRVRKNNGFIDTYDILFTERACWVQTEYDSKIMEFGARGQDLSAVIFFTEDPSLNEKDIVIYGDDTFEVQSSADPDASAGIGIVYRVMVNRTTTGSTGTV